MKLGRYFSFAGRTSRLGYWRLQAPLALFIAVFWCGGFLLAEATHLDWLSGAGVIAILPVSWAVVALWFRRLHDRNKSGWWILPFYLGPVALELVVYALSGRGESQTAAVAALIGLVLWLWAFVEVGLLGGTPGPNRFGADPRAA
jgi:uncharacterized membrane protein YhaH (DUF805 family)